MQSVTQDVQRYYDDLAANGPYATLAPGNRGKSKSRYVAEVFDAALMPLLKKETIPLRLLDFGCGTGIFTVKARTYAKEIVGVDLSRGESRFQSRPWDLIRHTESVCPLCSNGCNVILDVRHRQKREELLRIRPRENQAVNRWWMCDEGRFTFGYYHDLARLRTALRREGAQHVETPVDELLSAVAAELRRIVTTFGERSVGCIVSTRHPTEELFLVRRCIRDILRTPHLDHRVRPVQWEPADVSEDGLLRRTDKTANGRGARDLDMLPGPEGLDTRGMIAAALAGQLKALIVLEGINIL